MAAIRFLFCTFFVAASCARIIKQDKSEIEKIEEYITNTKPEINPRFRPLYHVVPPVGWMNDPNGFTFYKGEYHLFYQFYPYDSMWGPMHWGHVSSPNLVEWNQLPVAIIPEEEQCFSGSAIVEGDNMILMYTGHRDIENEPANETQYLAFSNNGIDFEKYEGNPVLAKSPNGSPDFRDPKAWKNGDYYYVILGSKTDDERGRVLLYRSPNMVDWEFLTVMGESNGTMGYMWECPDFFELDGKFVLLMSPQGLEPQGDRYKNVYQNGYIIGSFNYDTFEFIPEIDFQETDYGHDFYAAQTTENDGKRYLLAWFGMWEVDHPEEVDGWYGSMTMVRELSIRDNRILMKPVEDITSIRDSLQTIDDFSYDEEISFGKAVEIKINGDLNEDITLLLEGINGGDNVYLRWIRDVSKVQVDRNGDIRQVEWYPASNMSWRLFLDASSLELFCGDGEVVFSTRVYPDGEWKITNLSKQSLSIEAYNLNRSVPE